MLYAALSEVSDPRRGQAKQYDLGVVLFCSVLAILSGATSYRKIYAFMDTRFKKLKEIFELPWKEVPSYSTIRRIIQSVQPKDLEEAFRKHAKYLAQLKSDSKKHQTVSIDGKVVRGSFDHFEDQKSIQVLSAFLSQLGFYSETHNLNSSNFSLGVR